MELYFQWFLETMILPPGLRPYDPGAGLYAMCVQLFTQVQGALPYGME